MEYEIFFPFRHFSEKLINNNNPFCKYYDEEMIIGDELSEKEFDKNYSMDDYDDFDEINNEKSNFHYIM